LAEAVSAEGTVEMLMAALMLSDVHPVF